VVFDTNISIVGIQPAKQGKNKSPFQSQFCNPGSPSEYSNLEQFKKHGFCGQIHFSRALSVERIFW